MPILTIVIDVIIILMLGAGVYAALRLSKALKTFNTAKKDMRGLIEEVSGAITKADEAVKNFKANMAQSSQNLDKKIQEAKMLSDELELIHQSSSRIADRLEKLMDDTPSKARRPASSSASASSSSATKKSATASEKRTDKPSTASKATSWIKGGKSMSKDEDAGSIFSIRDPDYEQGLKEQAGTSSAWDGPEDLESDAERALYDALRGKQNKS
tara:strand:+ start:240 stop:881 length:642 start_codon:yes stop_codon:yes gene_type:complete